MKDGKEAEWIPGVKDIVPLVESMEDGMDPWGERNSSSCIDNGEKGKEEELICGMRGIFPLV
jgi:hypothetical protein